VKTPILAVAACLTFLVFPGPAQAGEKSAPALLTVAEKSDFKATSRHDDVLDFCERLAKQAPLVRIGELGKSVQGRKLPLIIVADPPVADAEQAARSGKLVVFAMGNIHAGEVDGKEALLMLARDLATAQERRLLKDLILVFAPDVNPDGGEKMSKTNRPYQAGPAEVGERANAQGFDLNRDFVKLETPEVRALVRFFNKWDPALVIDTHTTNGSYHRYAITYDGPRHPAADPRLVTFVRDTLLPDVGRRLEKRTGSKSFFYGNFSKDRERWESYPVLPRYGIQYLGLRNRIAILSESYSYAPYRDRVLATRAFVQACIDYAAENRETIRKLLKESRQDEAKRIEPVALAHKLAPLAKPVTILGFVEEQKDGKRVATAKPRDYLVPYLGRADAALTVSRPHAYLFSPTHGKVVEKLQQHGIDVEELREDIELDVEIYRTLNISRATRPFQKHHLVSLQVKPRAETRRIDAGTIVVRTAQPLGTLAAFLLEPQSEDGLCAWNFFDEALKEGEDYPVLRLAGQMPMTTGKLRPLPEDRKRNRVITLETLLAKEPLNLSGNAVGGNPVARLTWLDDGEHYLQVRQGRLYKVHARSGRSAPFHDPAKMAQGLRSLASLDKDDADSLARQTSFRMNPERSGALFEHDGDLYFATFDGSTAVRLTKTPGEEELASFSPDGRFVAFVRDYNLYVVDIATQTERPLTKDGTGLISNGKADWVYYEELFNRSWKAYWWSPDSGSIIFLRFDDRPLPKAVLIDHVATHQKVESTPYPKAGDPNPLVKLGIVSVAGEPVRWVDTTGYSETASLIVRAGFTPDSKQAYFYVQDRAQTWLDVCTVPRDGGKPTRLLRDSTKAWIEDPGPPSFLKDGSFLLTSERSGYKHIYRFDRAGKLLGPVTSGPWEITSGLFAPHPILAVDEEAGWIYFTGKRDSPLASNLYRARLDGDSLERLTSGPGDHRVEVSPKASLFLDTWSDHRTTAKVRLCQSDGKPVRTVDTNPVYALEEYKLGDYQLLKIPTPDGFIVEGSLLKPPDFDARKKYPVWFKTYGGPHAPTIRDSWFGGQVADHAAAQMGFIVFRCDPRSASGKGAVSTWTAYRQLGVQELKDIEAAIRWLCMHSYIDAERIGMSGGSYGGFLTAYAMTHSKLFAAGIAAAPVTDWRLYDSIYTERYMNTPQENPEGYDATSVIKAAKNLHGKLLLVHGLKDDNVYWQNTVQLIDALQRADRDFEVMIYPRARHGVGGRHNQRLTYDFMRRTLQPQR